MMQYFMSVAPSVVARYLDTIHVCQAPPLPGVASDALADYTQKDAEKTHLPEQPHTACGLYSCLLYTSDAADE